MKHMIKRLMIWESIGYIILLVFVFGQALFPPTGQMIFGDDIHHQYYFFRQFLNQFLHSGSIPWWNPYIFGGQPFIADPMVNMWYPLNWLYIFLPLNIAYSWHIVFHIFWACLGMNVLVKTMSRKQGANTQNETKGSDMASWVSGVVFGLSGFFMARTYGGHVDVIAAASWIPWVVWAFDSFIHASVGENFLNPLLANTSKTVSLGRNGHILSSFVSELGKRFSKILSPFASKKLIIAVVFFAFQLLSGYQTMAFMTGIIVGIMAVIHSVFTRRWQPVVYAIAAGLLGVALAAFHILPVQEFFRLSIRTYPLPYTWVSYGSWTWQSVIQLLYPFFFGDVKTYMGPPPNFIEHSAFIGVGGIVLSLVGVMRCIEYAIRAKQKGTIAPLWGIGCIGITIFGVWISLGPHAPIDLQRILWNIIPMYHFLRIPPRHLILVIFGLSALSGIGLDALIRSFRISPVLKWLVVLGISIEMVAFARNFIELKPVPEIREDPALISLLQSNKEPYRVLQDFGVWLPQREAMEFDAGMPKGIFSATGYDTSILRSYFEFVSSATGKTGGEAVLSHDVQIPYMTPAASEALDFLNIRHILVPRSYDPYSGNQRYRMVYENSEKDIRLYENTTVKPRFFLKDEGCGDVRVRSYTPNTIVLDVVSTCDSTLVSSEAWYPGWSAKVDGKKTDIHKLNGAFRVLSVSPGNHTVIYTYHPAIFIVGGGISLLTIFLLWYVYRRSHS